SSQVTPCTDQGRQTYALAVPGRTAQQAGHASGAVPMTIDSFVARVNQVGGAAKYRHAALIVDEAAMIDHHRYAGLLEAAADAQATLVQIGDDEQLSPVGPGGLWTIFHGLAEQLGHATELQQIHRARNPLEAQAWTDLREGRTEQALTWYRDVGQLRLYDTRQELREGMVAEWWARNPEGVMLVDTSNAERDLLNQLAQVRRLEAGGLPLGAHRPSSRAGAGLCPPPRQRAGHDDRELPRRSGQRADRQGRPLRAGQPEPGGHPHPRP